MNKKILGILGVGLIPIGAILLNACGPVADSNEMALSDASNEWMKINGVYSEYGRCNDTQDNDGDGRADSYDPDCHLNVGPLRDLSTAPFPVGHNFNPDVSKIPVGGPGYPGGFRDPVQFARWFRFLTALNGNTHGIALMAPDVNHDKVPVPAPLLTKPVMGAYAQGNNNNIDARVLDGEIFPTAIVQSASKAPNAYQNAAIVIDPAKLRPQILNHRAIGGGLYKGGSMGGMDLGRRPSTDSAESANTALDPDSNGKETVPRPSSGSGGPVDVE